LTVLGAFRDLDIPDVLGDMGLYVQEGLLQEPIAPTTFVFTGVSVANGRAVYSYSSYAGPAPLVGRPLTVNGFGIAGNNVSGKAITAIASGSVTVAATTQANESHAGTGSTPAWVKPMPAPTPGVTPMGLLDENDQAIAADRGDLGVVAMPRTLVVQASAFPGVKVDDALVLTDQNDLTERLQVFVSNRIKEGDAALSRFELRVVK
jgi:hypothetical protein